ncbi:MAG: hypothetical protein QNK37_03100 [Acidobacteriota bacterium]|nr:hypothetical protein [Acidobacteriota bacterium]
MTKLSENWGDLRVDIPAVYRIRVRGHIDVSFSDRLNGMQITYNSSEDGQVISTLIGRVTDQAALTGVLTTLGEWRMSLLTVECIDVEEDLP